MDVKQLRYFVAIVEEGSFSRAAARVNVAQPALSLHVRKMEEALGTALLLRGPQGVTVTEAGEVLLRRARAVLADLDQTEEEIRSIGREPSGTVRVGLPGTISGIVAVPLIARCRARLPRIKIIIAEAMSGFVREWLIEGRVELAVLYTDLKETGIRCEALLDEEIVLLTSADTGEGSALEILATTDLILPSEAHGLRQMLDTTLRAQGVTVDPAIEVDSYDNIKRLVAEGYGCSALPFHAVEAEARSGRLSTRRFPEPRLWRSAYLAHVTARPTTRAAEAVADELRNVVAEMVGAGTWAGARHPGAGA